MSDKEDGCLITYISFSLWQKKKTPFPRRFLPRVPLAKIGSQADSLINLQGAREVELPSLVLGH